MPILKSRKQPGISLSVPNQRMSNKTKERDITDTFHSMIWTLSCAGQIVKSE